MRFEEVESLGFEVRVGVMSEAAVVEPPLQLGVMAEERLSVSELEGLMVVAHLLVSPLTPLSFSSHLLASASASTPPEAAASDLSPKASPHPPFSFSPLSTSLLSLLRPPRFPSLPRSSP